jgi:tight adherence protein B
MMRLGLRRYGAAEANRSIRSRTREFTSRSKHLLLPGASLAGGLLGFSLLGPIGMLAGGAAGPGAVRAQRVRTRAKRRELLDQQLVEAVVSMAAAVRAGLSVRRAVAEAAESAEPPLRGELNSVLQRLETGEPLDVALGRLGASLALSDAALLVDALAVHRRTGGDLPRLLDEIAGVVRVRLIDRRAVRALTAQARSSGVVLAVLPVGFVALLSGTGGGGLGAFYRSPSGALVLLVALSLQGLGFLWMRRILKGIDDA